MVKTKYMHLKVHCQILWLRFLSNQHHLYPYMSKLIEIMLVVLTSSSVVERGFSTVRHVLRENRLSMQNARLNQILIVKCNLPVLWRIISDAVDSILNEAVELSQNMTKWCWNLHTSDLRKGKFRFISLAHCGGKNMIFIMG